METASQVLHRPTSYEPGREWTDPISDPRVVQDLEVNDLSRLPWFFKMAARCRGDLLESEASRILAQAGPSEYTLRSEDRHATHVSARVRAPVLRVLRVRRVGQTGS